MKQILTAICLNDEFDCPYYSSNPYTPEKYSKCYNFILSESAIVVFFLLCHTESSLVFLGLGFVFQVSFHLYVI